MRNRKRIAAALAAAGLLVGAGVAHGANLLSFDGASYRVFSGTGKLGQRWDPSMVSVSNGVLSERISGDVSGGVGSTHWFTYGTVSARFRISPGAGKMVILLSGHEGTPYNELDIAETSKGDSGRTRITATRHWGTGRSNLSQARVSGDFTKWHTVTMTWTSSRMSVAMDGRTFGTWTTHVSHTPMHLAAQTAGASVAGAGAPATLQVTNVSTP